jgi:hypothetical protein
LIALKIVVVLLSWNSLDVSIEALDGGSCGSQDVSDDSVGDLANEISHISSALLAVGNEGKLKFIGEEVHPAIAFASEHLCRWAGNGE